jgi:hypothetical protein
VGTFLIEEETVLAELDDVVVEYVLLEDVGVLPVLLDSGVLHVFDAVEELGQELHGGMEIPGFQLAYFGFALDLVVHEAEDHLEVADLQGCSNFIYFQLNRDLFDLLLPCGRCLLLRCLELLPLILVSLQPGYFKHERA